MPERQDRSGDSLPTDSFGRIDEACLRFEAAWKAGERPDIGAFLGELDDEAGRRALLPELLAVELHYRAKAGEDVGRETYLARFPGCNGLVERVFDQCPPVERRNCAQALDKAMHQGCNNCGAELLPDSNDCPVCGKQRTLEYSSPIRADKLFDTNVQSIMLPAEQPLTDGDGAKVEKLLEQIAAQSHFEERYELRGTLAKGGMGEILRAYDRILRRDVAVKMMLKGLSGDSPAIRGQFLKEARVGGRLLHPHILAVFDLGVNRSRQIYYTMRLVDGASLQKCLTSLEESVATKMVDYPLRKLVEILVKACQGVDYAHQNGVIRWCPASIARTQVSQGKACGCVPAFMLVFQRYAAVQWKPDTTRNSSRHKTSQYLGIGFQRSVRDRLGSSPG